MIKGLDAEAMSNSSCRRFMFLMFRPIKMLDESMLSALNITQADCDRALKELNNLEALKKEIERDLWGPDFTNNKSTLQSSGITKEDYIFKINRPGPSRSVIQLSFLHDRQHDPTEEINHVLRKWADRMLDIHISIQHEPTVFIPH
jgi:hypothetical protein